MSTVILLRNYKASFIVKSEQCCANFSVALECQKCPNRFHMKVLHQDYFLNSAKNILNWPIKEWSLIQVQECLRVFEKEYLPACRHLSQLIDDKYFTSTDIIYVTNGYVQKEIRICSHDIAQVMWDGLNIDILEEIHVNPGHEWVEFDTCEHFCVCDAFRDCGYIEDPFPFLGGTDAFGTSVASAVDFYNRYFPTMMSLTQTS